MVDLEALRRRVAETCEDHGAHLAAAHLRNIPIAGKKRGWVAAWHAAIGHCREEVEYHAGGGRDMHEASAALRELFNGLCEDHEEARRCASR